MRVAADRRFDAPLRRRRTSPDKRQILFKHLPFGKTAAEFPVGRVAPGNNDDAGGILVEAMHETGTVLFADLTEFPGVMDKR